MIVRILKKEDIHAKPPSNEAAKKNLALLRLCVIFLTG